MRVATALTGMTACAAGFLPTATAQAAVRGVQLPEKAEGLTPAKAKIVRLGVTPGRQAMGPDDIVSSAYWLDIKFKKSVTDYQVCGYHRPNYAYRCTSYASILATKSYTLNHIGGNKYSWLPGPITIRWDGGGAGLNDGCNTSNGDWYGSLRLGADSRFSYLLSAPNGTGIGDGVPTC